MGWKQAEYIEVRDKMQPGDVIAFAGKGDLSEIVKWATKSSVSHVGVILQTKLLIRNQPQDGYMNQIVESAIFNGFSGVTINRLSDRFANYDGEIWWLPLSNAVRQKMNVKKFYDFLLHQEHKPYDVPQSIRAVLDVFDKTPFLEHLTRNVEDFSRFFCSELVAAGLEESGGIPRINASEVTPADLCMFALYQADYYQLKGDARTIKGYNSVAVAEWGTDNP